MPKYRVLTPARIGGQRREIGATIELSVKAAARIRPGIIEITPSAAAEAADKEGEPHAAGPPPEEVPAQPRARTSKG